MAMEYRFELKNTEICFSLVLQDGITDEDALTVAGDKLQKLLSNDDFGFSISFTASPELEGVRIYPQLSQDAQEPMLEASCIELVDNYPIIENGWGNT